MIEPAAGLFRQQAVEFHRGGSLRGDVLHITPAMFGAVQWLLAAITAVGLVFVASAQVRSYAVGPAVVLMEQRHAVGTDRAGVIRAIFVQIGQQVRAGQVLLSLSATSEEAELAALERQLDDQLVQLLREPDDRTAREAVLTLRARTALARATLERSDLRAPVAGRVVDLRARVGQAVVPGVPLLAVQALTQGADIVMLLPGADRPRIHTSMPVCLRIQGYERARLELQVSRVDEQVIGPAAALRAVGEELAGALETTGPTVLVYAHLAQTVFRAGHASYQLHHGMLARGELAVERQPLLFAWFPSLERAFGDVL